MSNLAQWLLEAKLLSAEQLDLAERQQAANNIPLSMALIELDLVDEPDLVELLAQKHNLPKAPRKLHKLTVPPKALSAIPQDHCWQHGLFPFGVDLPARTLQVAILDPSDREALAFLEKLASGLEAELYVAGPKQIEKAIRRHFMDSIVDDTASPKLRFFGYDHITSPGAKAERGESSQDLERIVVAESRPAQSPGRPPSERALDLRNLAAAQVGASPAPTGRETAPGVGTVGTERAERRTPPTPHAREERHPPSSAHPPVRERPPSSVQAPVRERPASGPHAPTDRTARLEARVEVLERALEELLLLLSRSSSTVGDQAAQIAQTLGPTPREGGR